MTRSTAEVLAALDQPRLLVVGDIVVDRYRSGPVERISPEAPIPVLRVEAEREGLGCAASVAQIAGAVGADVVLLGLTGDDAEAQTLAGLAESAGIRLRTVVEADRPTSVKTRFLAHSHTTHQQVLRVDRETTAPLTDVSAAALRAAVDEELPSADAVLISDYGKGCLTPEIIAHVIAGAQARGIPVLVDPKGTDYTRYRGATGITPNRPETQAATGIAVREIADAERAGAELVATLDLQFALVTLDREGMYLRPQSGEGVHIPTTPREVFDVTGAGDMVLAMLATGLASGATPVEAAQLANLAAGIAVERIGVATVTRDEIAARLVHTDQGAEGKHVPRPDARALGERLRAAQKRVVFTNGCFDILHAGHVAYLQRAKAEGDVLVLGLNSDASVTRLKGPERPVQSEADRVRVLCGLASVDYVVVFEEDTPAEIVADLLPDVLVKGADWKAKGAVGADTVEARGGRVVFVELLDGRSTTEIARRIKGGGG